MPSPLSNNKSPDPFPLPRCYANAAARGQIPSPPSMDNHPDRFPPPRRYVTPAGGGEIPSSPPMDKSLDRFPLPRRDAAPAVGSRTPAPPSMENPSDCLPPPRRHSTAISEAGIPSPHPVDKSPDRFPSPCRYTTAATGGGGGGGGTILASCALAACFLLLVAIALSLTFFFLFRPRSPTIKVSAVQIPGFVYGNGTVSFTFSQYAAVRNPNRAAFSHYDSSLQLIYAGSQVGLIYIPAGEIDGGRTKYMGGKFAVDSFPIAAAPAPVGSVEVESRMRVKGRVRVLRFFTHDVEATAGCSVGVSSGDGSVIGIRC